MVGQTVDFLHSVMAARFTPVEASVFSWENIETKKKEVWLFPVTVGNRTQTGTFELPLKPIATATEIPFIVFKPVTV